MIPAPEAQETAVKEIAELWAKRLKDALLSALDDGWLIFKKGKPRDRLAGYMANTLAADMMWVQIPEYAQAFRDGLVPPLMAMQMADARKQAQVQVEQMMAAGQQMQADGMPMPVETPQLPPAPPMFWVQIMELPVYVFEHLSRDFKQLLKAQAERETT